MPSAFDVAQYILSSKGTMSAMKLQKLVYYSQAWSTVWDDDVLFNEAIEAWENGPVVRELWESHRGAFRIHAISKGEPRRLSDAQRNTVDTVLKFYGDKDAQWLSDLTHMEKPWIDAWNSVDRTITPAALSEYYSSIEPGGQ